MKDIKKIVKSIEEPALVRISEAIKNETKEKESGFLLMSSGALAANIVGNA